MSDEEEENPFDEDNKEQEIEYIDEDVKIPTKEQAAEEERSAQAISTLSLEMKELKLETTTLPLLKPLPYITPVIPRLSSYFTPPKLPEPKPNMAMTSSSSTKNDNKMKFKSPLTFEGK